MTAAPRGAARAEITLTARVARSDIPILCARLELELELGRVRVVACDASALTHADAVAIDAIARLALMSHRSGSRFVLLSAKGDLMALLELVGLAGAASVPEVIGQPESPEQVGVEEVDDPADPAG